MGAQRGVAMQRRVDPEERAADGGRAAATDPAGSFVTVDSAAVARNWRRLTQRTGAEVGAVVKADAYGHGIVDVAPALAAAGCRTYFVALPEEGLALRRALPDAAIYVLNGVFGDPREAIGARLTSFLSSGEAVAEWPADAPFALNVDTGMNRLGLTVPEALAYRGPRPALLASHFACADTPGHPKNVAQEEAFAAVRARFADVPASLANSAALLTRPAAHHDLVRPGIALFGACAAEGVAALEPTVRLEARIIQVRRAATGETVGYGAAQTLGRDSRIAIASLGYADGYLRAAGGSDAARGAPAAVNSVPVRLVGRVSMDLVAVDVTDAPCARGDLVELIGPNVPVDEVARHAGTIGYELLTGLSRRTERRVGPL